MSRGMQTPPAPNMTAASQMQMLSPPQAQQGMPKGNVPIQPGMGPAAPQETFQYGVPASDMAPIGMSPQMPASQASAAASSRPALAGMMNGLVADRVSAMQGRPQMPQMPSMPQRPTLPQQANPRAQAMISMLRGRRSR